MKVCILLPPTKDSTHYMRDICGGSSKGGSVYPPIFQMYWSALLKKNGIETIIIDSTAEKRSENDVLMIIKGYKPEFVILPLIIETLNTDLELAGKIKALEIKIISTGLSPTVLPEKILAHGVIDYCVRGEPDITILEICQGKKDEDIKGLSYIKDGKINHNSERELIKDLDTLPFPDIDSIKKENYRTALGRKEPMTIVITSRGCPGQCTFCRSELWYKRLWRARKAEAVIKEMALLKEKGYNEIFIRDETFTIGKKRAIRICDGIKKLNISWYCFSRIDTLNGDMIKAMAESGCHLIMFGIESGSQKILDKARKGITIEKVRETVILVKKRGIRVSGSFIIGLPGETKKTIKQTIDLAKELDLDYAQFALATPYPGTQLYETAKKENLIATTCWEKYNIFKSASLRTEELSSKELEEELKKAYKEFYLRPHYIKKKISEIKSINNLKQLITSAIELLK